MISFVKGSEYRQISRNQGELQNKQPNGKLVYLLDPSNDFKIFELIPRTFEISCKNVSCKFNIKLLKDVSPVIRELLKKDPKARRFQLSTFDCKILPLFEQLFQGKIVFFDEYQISSVQYFIDKLQITRCPKYMKKNNEGIIQNDENKELYLFNGVVMNPNYDFFLTNKIPKSFTIITNKKEYKCNKYGVYSSNLIRNLIKNQPDLKQYKYNFDDDFDEFQQICDLFNFQKITITPDNMDVIKEISDHFQIEVILPSVNKFIEKQAKVTQQIDNDQNSVDLIEELFEWLYNIKELTVENVKTSILDSNWSKSEVEIHELVAFILQVINNNISIHNELIELITSLDDELKTLIPFLNEMLMESFGSSINNCSFVYKMFKKGKIQKENLKKKLAETMKQYNSNVINNSISWFLPELIEFKLLDEKKIQNLKNSVSEYVISFLPDKIDIYKSIRDSDEPENLITKSIRNDDVDTFQSIIIKSNQIKKLSKSYISYNIFDSFPLEKINYLDYAAACGAIKCFKYLILNHQDVDQSTFNYAIIGGNIEIIKIIDQRLDIDNNSNLKPKIIPLIEKHRNNLFDWIFEQKFHINDINNNFINELVSCSIKNGNIHCLIEFIDKGYNLRSNAKSIGAINLAAQNGFYKLLDFLYNIVNKDAKDIIYNSEINSFIKFDNISIYKLLLKFNFEDSVFISIISSAILYDKRSLIDYFFNEQVKNGFKIKSNIINEFLLSSLKSDSKELFNHIIEKFKTFCKDKFEKFEWNIDLLETASLNNNVKAFYTIIKLLLKSENKYTFTICFINAVQSDSLEICKYLIENKLFTDFDFLLSKSRLLSTKNKDMLSLIIENFDSQLKETLLKLLLFPAIDNHNFELVEYLFKEGIFFDDVLFNAVSINDEKIVKLILKYKNDSKFVNKGSKKGTPLNIAVQNNNVCIVKILLSTPSIDPYSYDNKYKTPLMNSINNRNYEIINEFLTFYGDKIFDTKDQIDHILCQLSLDYKSNEQIKIFKRLISSARFGNILDAYNQIFLINICSKNQFLDIVKLLLKINNINFNIYSPYNGDTPLIAAIRYKNVKIAELLINDPRVNINLKNYDAQCALTLAIQNKLIGIIELLIKNQKLDAKESSLNYAFIISDANISKILLSNKNIDINYKFYEVKSIYDTKITFKTALLQAVENDDREKIDLIIKHPEFDKDKSLFKEAINLSTKNKKNECLTKLIELLSIKELNNLQIDGCSITELLINSQNDEILEKLVQNQDFLISDDDLFNISFQIFNITNKSYQFLKILLDFDKKHNNIINFRKYSYLTAFNEKPFLQSEQLIQIYENIIDLIVQNTKDDDTFNVMNSKLIRPFQKAILMQSEAYATALINTNKVEFDLPVYEDGNFKKYTSYFHIAAKSSNPKILKLLINKKIINESNINWLDSEGNSILMIASENLRLENVELICKFENLAYWIKNINNENVIDIVQNKIIAKKKSKTKLFQMETDVYWDESIKKQLISLINEALGNLVDYDRDDYHPNSNYDNDIFVDENENEDEDDDIPVIYDAQNQSSQYSYRYSWKQNSYIFQKEQNCGTTSQENKADSNNINKYTISKTGKENTSSYSPSTQSIQKQSSEMKQNSIISKYGAISQENKAADSNNTNNKDTITKSENSSILRKSSKYEQDTPLSHKFGSNDRSTISGWGNQTQKENSSSQTPNLATWWQHKNYSNSWITGKSSNGWGNMKKELNVQQHTNGFLSSQKETVEENNEAQICQNKK